MYPDTSFTRLSPKCRTPTHYTRDYKHIQFVLQSRFSGSRAMSRLSFNKYTTLLNNRSRDLLKAIRQICLPDSGVEINKTWTACNLSYFCVALRRARNSDFHFILQQILLSAVYVDRQNVFIIQGFFVCQFLPFSCYRCMSSV